jgi:hypothetical protein
MTKMQLVPVDFYGKVKDFSQDGMFLGFIQRLYCEERIQKIEEFSVDDKFYQQFYTILKKLIDVAKQNEVNPRGIELFLRHLKEAPNAYKQRYLFYETIKSQLEEITFLLGSKNKKSIKSELHYLSEQMELCGPGIFNTVMDLHDSLSDSNDTGILLTKLRDNILYSVAQEYIEENKIDPLYSIHVHSALKQNAWKYDYPISHGINFIGLKDEYARFDTIKLDENKIEELFDEMKRRYTVDKMVDYLTLHHISKLNDFDGVNLSHCIQEFNRVINPFLPMYDYEDIVLHDEDYRDVKLKPDFIKNLKLHVAKLLKWKYFVKEVSEDEVMKVAGEKINAKRDTKNGEGKKPNGLDLPKGVNLAVENKGVLKNTRGVMKEKQGKSVVDGKYYEPSSNRDDIEADSHSPNDKSNFGKRETAKNITSDKGGSDYFPKRKGAKACEMCNEKSTACAIHEDNVHQLFNVEVPLKNAFKNSVDSFNKALQQVISHVEKKAMSKVKKNFFKKDGGGYKAPVELVNDTLKLGESFSKDTITDYKGKANELIKSEPVLAGHMMQLANAAISMMIIFTCYLFAEIFNFKPSLINPFSLQASKKETSNFEALPLM